MIEAVGVSKFYGARRALADVSFSIAQGEVVGFLGLNGAGKTTVLKVLCGLLVPSAGKVSVDGIDGIDAPRELRKRIGFLPDRPPLFPEMTVRQMVAYAARLCGLPAERVDRRVAEVLELCGLANVADDLIEWLSHGYRQRVGIAIAVAHEPKLVVLDEPISGLDPAQIVAMRGLIRGLKEKHTVLLSSHILSEISHTCDRILVLHQGRIVAQGTEATLAAGVSPPVEVTARGTMADLAKAEIHKLEGVSELETTDVGNGVVRLCARVASDTAREQLVATLVQRGLGVRSVSDAEGGLESVFLKLTKGVEA
ncbi:MAG: ABC transporter ATP-binding protein [Deltaproteobacteria bacterium]|nr:ABC transporter ATP-binding protein [Deltaproteobacteria bacterium]